MSAPVPGKSRTQFPRISVLLLLGFTTNGTLAIVVSNVSGFIARVIPYLSVGLFLSLAAGLLLGSIAFATLAFLANSRSARVLAGFVLIGAVGISILVLMIEEIKIFDNSDMFASGLFISSAILFPDALIIRTARNYQFRPRLSFRLTSIAIFSLGAPILSTAVGLVISDVFTVVPIIIFALEGLAGLLIMASWFLFARGSHNAKPSIISNSEKARRVQIFQAILILSLIALILSPGLLSSGSSSGIVQAGNVKTPIKHIVIMMMENHSFDNILGVYPTRNQSSSSQNPLTASIETPNNLLGQKNLPKLYAVPSGQFSTQDPVEGYYAYHMDFDNGKNDRFEQVSGNQSMTYWTDAQLSGEWDLVEQYALGDNYFASTLTGTYPNRVMSLAGYTPVIDNYGPPPFVPLEQSIFAELSSYGVSWGYYYPPTATATLQKINLGLAYFYGLDQYSKNLGTTNDFSEALSSGTLPTVSWVMPSTFGGLTLISDLESTSQHPSGNMTFGEQWMLGMINQVMNSAYWNSTAIFLTYDEGGGYYDHVAPPTLDGQQLGFRVPFVVISPYAKEDYVSHAFLNHGSMLAFIDYNFGLPALNKFVSDSIVPLDFFNFNSTYSNGSLLRGPVFLNAGSPFPSEPQIPFAALPYSRNGSSLFSLSQVGPDLYVSSNLAYTPFYETNEALMVSTGILVFGIYFVARKSP